MWNPFKKKDPKPSLEDVERPPVPRKPRTPKVTLSPKDLATKNGEPYINVVSIELDPEDPTTGSFEFEWNDIFVARLIKAGYKGKTDADIVDQWYHTICSNVLNDMFEQEMADPSKRAAFERKRDLGDGRSEFR